MVSPAFLTLTLLLATIHAVHGRAAKPHILFVLADDYGWNDIGYNGEEIPTPHLDQLAASGIKFDNYYVQPVCTPSRAALMTGRYPIRYGLQHYVVQPPIPAGLFLNETTLPTKLRESGYATHAIGKWHLGFFEWEYTPTYRGFDSHLGYFTGGEGYYNHIPDGSSMRGFDFRNNTEPLLIANGTYSSTWFADEAERIVNNYARDASPDKKPLFMYLAMQTCHEPLEYPPDAEKEQCSHLQDEKRKKFCTMSINLDTTVRTVTEAFQTAGMWEDTLLVFSTDNGAHPQLGGSNWPLRGGKNTLWEGGMRGVAFVTGAGIPSDLAGSTNTGLMHISDWFPTLLGVAGANTSGTFPLDGVDQWSAITRNTSSARTEILHNIDEKENIAAFRSGDWKVIVGNQTYDGWFYPPTNKTQLSRDIISDPVPVYLFNIAADPTEHNNLADQNPQKVKELLAKIAEYQSGTGFVEAWTPDSDPASNPKLHGGVWGPWKNETASKVKHIA